MVEKLDVKLTDREKLHRIEEILSGGSTTKILDNLKKEIKEKLNFDVDLGFDGTIKRYWWNERPTRAPRKKKEAKPTEEKEKEETKPTEKKK